MVPLVGLALAPVSGRITERVGTRLLTTGWLAVMTVGLAALAAPAAPV